MVPPAVLRVFEDQQQGAGFRCLAGVRGDEGRGLVQPPPQPEDHHRQRCADEERNTPAPGRQIGLGHGLLQHDQQQQGQQLTRDQRHILEAGPEAAVLRGGHLGQIGGGGAVFAADAESLQHAGEQQQSRGSEADAGVTGGAGDDQTAGAHQGHGQGQSGLAPPTVGIDSHDPGPDGSHQKADRKHRRRAQQLGRAVALWKEDRCEIDGEGRIGEPVEPFDQIAGRSADDVLQAAGGGHGGIGRAIAGAGHGHLLAEREGHATRAGPPTRTAVCSSEARALRIPPAIRNGLAGTV